MNKKWLLYGALAGLAAWLIWWRKSSASTGISVSVSVPEITEGGPFGVWTQVTNNGQVPKTVIATAVGDVGGIQLSFSPPSLSFILDPAQVLTNYFWFSVPAGTEGLSGQVTVNVDGVSDTAGFVVQPIP